MYILQLPRKDNPSAIEAVIHSANIQDLLKFLELHTEDLEGGVRKLKAPLDDYDLPKKGDFLKNQTVLALTSLDARIAEAQDHAAKEIETAWTELMANTYDATLYLEKGVLTHG